MATKRNAPITATQAAVLKDILSAHGWSPSRPAQHTKRAPTWKTRFGSRAKMMKHMKKMRRLAKKGRR